MRDPNLHDLTASINAIASPFYAYLSDLHTTYQPLVEGSLADLWADQAEVCPHWFGLAVVTQEGQVYEVGHCQRAFPIQSLSRALIYGLALEDWGREIVSQKVGVESAAENPHTITLNKQDHRPPNPLVMAGAIAVTDLIQGHGPAARLRRILDLLERYTGRCLSLSLPVFMTDKEQGHQERAAAHLMLKYGIVSDRLSDTLDLYFQQGAIQVTSRDLAMIAATLANGGVNPLTGVKALDERYVQDVISVLFSCGMDGQSGQWIHQVGMPAQGSPSGGMLAMVPQKLGIGIFSPPLNPQGISVRGTKICAALSQDEGLHLFNIYAKNQEMLKYIEQVNKVTHAAAALENDAFEPHVLQSVTERDDELGQLARVFLRMVEQVQAREQSLKQQVEELRIELDETKVEQQVAEIVETEEFKSLQAKLQQIKQARQQWEPS